MSDAIVGRPGEESSDYLLLGSIDPSLCPCDECRADRLSGNLASGGEFNA